MKASEYQIDSIDQSVARADLIAREARERAEKTRRQITIRAEHEKIRAESHARMLENLRQITESWRGFIRAQDGVEELLVDAELAPNKEGLHVSVEMTGIRAATSKYGLVIAFVDADARTLIPRIREVVESALHPRPIEPLELAGFVVLSGASGQYPATFVFRGFTPEIPCACAPGGPGHRFKAREVWISLGLWSFAPGESFDAPPHTEQEIAKYLKAEYVIDLFAETTRAKELAENPPPKPLDPVEEAVKAFKEDRLR